MSLKEKKQKILITGCLGFIGSHLSEKLCQDGHEVVGIDWMKSSKDRKLINKELLLKYENFNLIYGDIRLDLPEENFDVVFHLAALAGVRASLDNPVITTDVNLGGTTNIFDWATRGFCSLIIYASSSSVYGVSTDLPFSENATLSFPNSPYAASKIASEVMGSTYCRLFPIRSVGLRFFTVYGPRGREDMAIHKFLKWIDSEEPVTFFGDGSSSRDYTYIDDIVDGIVKSSDFALNKMKDHDHEIFNLGNNSPVSLNELISLIEKTVGKTAILNYLPDQKGDVPTTLADISKPIKEINYNPKTSLDKGLERTWDSIQKNMY